MKHALSGWLYHEEVYISQIEKSGDNFKTGLGLFDSVMVVVGIMIGSGIFIVPAEMAREIGSPLWLLVAWAITGVLTLAAAASYGELASMLPFVGGMYVYLCRAFSPFVGFLYGWTLWMVIQTGSIAAVAIAFARYAGAWFPGIAEDHYLVAPHRFFHSRYAVSLSTVQLTAIGIILLLTFTNSRGLRWGKSVQNTLTLAKLGALAAIILLGFTLGINHAAVSANLSQMWTRHPLASTGLPLGAGAAGLVAALCIAQTGSLFSADSWHDITFVAAEVRTPSRILPRALLIGTAIVVIAYLLANVAFLTTLPFEAIQRAPGDRVASLLLQQVFPAFGARLMAMIIMVSTFGTVNALTLAGARAFYAMAKDGFFFRRAGRLSNSGVPSHALALQCAWSVFLVLPRIWQPATSTYGNLYSNLLDYIISVALLFYILTVAGLFRLRLKEPGLLRPYRVIGYPWVPLLYVAGAAIIVIFLFVDRPATTWPGLVIVFCGAPVYYLFRKAASKHEAPNLLRTNRTSPS